MKNTVILLFSIIVLSSCSNDIHFKEFKKTDNLEWLQSDAKLVSFENTDDSSYFDLYFGFRYAQGFQYNAINANIKELTPFGNFEIPITAKTINDDGTYIGDGSGDIWDLEIPLRKHIQLAKGKYSYIISHTMPTNKLQMVMEVGIVIKKCK